MTPLSWLLLPKIIRRAIPKKLRISKCENLRGQELICVGLQTVVMRCSRTASWGQLL